MNAPAMDIPINVDVKCCDKTCGRTTFVVLNPVNQEITHIVVKQRAYPYADRLVPVDVIAETSPHLVRLRCDGPSLDSMERFIENDFLRAEEPRFFSGPYMMWPYAYTTEAFIPLEHERIPVGETAIRKGAQVRARDGQVGRVDEFLVDPTSEHITHLVLREGHVWGRKDVTIPVSSIERFDEDTVYLNLDKAVVEALPAVPIHRR